MPLRYAAPALPQVVQLPRSAQGRSGGGSGGGGNIGDLIKQLNNAISQSRQKDALAQTLLNARTGSGPTVGDVTPLPALDYSAGTGMPAVTVSDPDPDAVQMALANSYLNNAPAPASVPDTSGFNWAQGV